MKKNRILYAICLVISVVILGVSIALIYSDGSPYSSEDISHYTRAKILRITDTTVTSLDGADNMTETVYTMDVLVKSGEEKGSTKVAKQIISSYANYNPRPVTEGDNIIIYQSIEYDDNSWCFAEYVRSDVIIVLCAVFCIALIVFGRLKGAKTLLSLILTVASVFFVLVPSIIKGYNIYLITIAVCLYITAMTLIIVNGISKMSLVAGIGCMSGVLVAALITSVSDIFLKLSGYTDECSLYISYINDGAINIKSLVFAGILIGSIGAVMDVAVDIAASLHEISVKVKNPTFKELFKSGITISRNVIGTMSNTLILAYIGSSLCAVILIIYNNSFSMLNLFNKENIITELLKIITGSMGILSALPLTSLFSALIYTRKVNNTDNNNTDNNKDIEDPYIDMLNNINKK